MRRQWNGYVARNKRLKHMGFDSYREYLDSEQWKQIRARVLARDHGICCFCKGQGNIVHHTFYSKRALSGTSLNKLKTVCSKCHEFIEFDETGRKLTPKKMRLRERLLRQSLKAVS